MRKAAPQPRGEAAANLSKRSGDPVGSPPQLSAREPQELAADRPECWSTHVLPQQECSHTLRFIESQVIQIFVG